MSELINQPVSSIVIGDENDKAVFSRAAEVMKTDGSSYRVRFITRRPHHTISNNSTHQLSLPGSFPQSPSGSNPASINASCPDLSLSDSKDNKKTGSRSPFITGNFSSSDIPAQDSLPLSKWHSQTSNMTENPYLGDDFLEMEGQGVLIYDNITSEPSHVSIT